MIEPDSPIACTCALLRRVTRAVTRDFEAVLKPAGINVGQFTLLSMLTGEEGLPVAELAGRLDLDRTTLSRNLGPLLRDGLIAERGTDDHRVREITLTPKGRAVQSDARSLWAQAQEKYVSTLGLENWAALTGLLEETRTVAR